jgi:hypothetical protein
MRGGLRLLVFLTLPIFGLVTLYYLYREWQRVEKRVVVVMRSSNEDCDSEFRCIWRIERVISGNLTAKEATSSCYLMNSQRHYSQLDSIEWLRVEGLYTNEDGQAFYADCQGTLKFYDRSVRAVAKQIKTGEQ